MVYTYLLYDGKNWKFGEDDPFIEYKEGLISGECQLYRCHDNDGLIEYPVFSGADLTWTKVERFQ